MTTLITGNTYPVRAELRALGGTWSRAAQGWNVPADKADQARALVMSAPKYASRRTNRHAGYTRFSRGAEVYRNPRGRCEDAPCCGCCS
ncbi:MAG: hypothetical protein QOF48_3724 [Verrucomicrobiota bacterium]|jgi:hypothetical protein